MGKNKKDKKKRMPMSGSLEERVDVKNSIISNTILCWNIRNYCDLKNYAIYYQTYEDNNLSCVFKLIKTKENLYVALRCGIHHKQTTFYLANGELTPPVSISIEIADGLYAGYFQQAEIFSTSGDFYKTGLLTIVSSIALDEETTYTGEYGVRLGEMWDFDDLCNDIGNMYLQGNNSNFIINSMGGSFKVHKYILLARSEFFQEFFANRDHPSQFTVDANAGIMHLVLLYCYSGQLPGVAEDCLNSIQGIAKELKISSLVERCEDDLDRYRRNDS